MIFCGDMAVPNKECANKLVSAMEKSGIFKDETVVINLEGVLMDENPKDTFWKVYNDRNVVSLKNVCNKLVFNVANNHTYDYPESIQTMFRILKENDISFFGNDDGIIELDEYTLFGHCWEVYTKTNGNHKTKDRILDCDYQKFYEMVVRYINNHPGKKVICLFHWNFDMEKCPFPAYKKLAHDLIDYGVEAIIGNHAHVEQEIEVYRGKIIAYGLGNFYMPDGYFFNGKLSYPKESHFMQVVKLTGEGYSVYRFSTDTKDAAIQLDVVPMILETDKDFDDDQYLQFFKQNRKKGKMTPVFQEYSGAITRIKTKYCVLKIKFIRFLKMRIDRKTN